MDKYLEIWDFISTVFFPVFKFLVCLYVLKILSYVEWILMVIKHNTENSGEGDNNR